MMNYPKYESYKDSGIDWLGEIPSDWNTNKVKFLFYIGRGRVISQQELEENALYPVYSSQTSNNGVLGYINTFDFNYVQLTWTTDGANAGTVFLREGKHNCTNVCGTLKPVLDTNMNLSFMLYSLSLSTPFYKRPDTNGAKIMNGEMANIYLVEPPIQEQNLIAKFLDQKTSQIDEAIRIKEKQIELLKEQKQIMIQNAVTKGLDPNVKMKDSGVDWIGEIPEHWEVKKLKYLLSESTSRSITGEEELLSLSGYKGVIPRSLLEDRAGLAESLIGYKLVNKGNLVINRMQAVNGLLAVSQYDGLTSPDYAVYVERHKDLLDLTYIYFLLRLPIYLAEFKKRVTGVMEGFIRLYTDDLYDISISLPSYVEQKKIIQFIDNNLQKNFCAENNLINQIEKLKEYKTTLINSAVTGKIKVTPEMVGEA